jgi:hypothetical protein
LNALGIGRPLSSCLNRAEAARARPERTKPIIAEKNAFSLLYASGPDCPLAKGWRLMSAAFLMLPDAVWCCLMTRATPQRDAR